MWLYFVSYHKLYKPYFIVCCTVKHRHFRHNMFHGSTFKFKCWLRNDMLYIRMTFHSLGFPRGTSYRVEWSFHMNYTTTQGLLGISPNTDSLVNFAIFNSLDIYNKDNLTIIHPLPIKQIFIGSDQKEIFTATVITVLPVDSFTTAH